MAGKKRPQFKTLKTLAAIGFAAGVFFAGILLIWAATLKIPSLESFNDRIVRQSTKIYDRTGETLLYDMSQDVTRTVVPFEDISRNIKNATVAIEDEEFYDHAGIKPTAILRAILVNLSDLEFSQGGSTITQQVVKNSLLTQDKTIARKLKEWILALKLEQKMGKEEILNFYLNESPYGGTIYGVEEASRAFFDKSAADVTLAEAAYLAALPKAPTYYSPYGQHRDELDARKDVVLERMRVNGFITDSEYQSAKNERVEFAQERYTGIRAPHFVMYVREQLAERYGERALMDRGLKVITTLNWDMQKEAENIVYQRALENTEKFNATNAGLVAIDPQTGEILAMVGSRDYFDAKIQGNFNITLAHRQPGSAFKPFVYATAFKKGYTPDTVVFDLKTQFSTACAPTNFTSDGDCYSPVNYDGEFRGPISLRDALAQSVNVPAVKTLYLAGLDDSLETARDMGISSLGDASQYGLTLVLGGGEVSLLEMTSAYGVFAAEGERYDDYSILRVEDADGSVIDSFEPKRERVLDENVALTITDVLSDNAARTPAFGSNSPLYFPGRDVAAKTGTTNNYRDAWIIGYTPNIVVGAWAGNNDNTPMEKRVAGFTVAPMWNDFMKYTFTVREGNEQFRDPAPIDTSSLKPILRGRWQGGQQVLVDSRTGNLADENTPLQYREVRSIGGSIHSILYWVDKNNPRGPAPTNPAVDPQYTLWEAPIRIWALGRRTTDEADISLSDTRAVSSVEITSPQNGDILKMNERVTAKIDHRGNTALSQVEYFINNTLIGSASTAPFSFSFIPQDVTNIQAQNTLKVVAHDVLFNTAEAEVKFEVE